jgi:hypothetical protein
LNQRGGEPKTKNKLTPIIAVLFLILTIAPAMAKPIGPQKATNTPHFIVTRPGTVEHFLPSGTANEWTSDTESNAIDIVHVVDASKAKIPDAIPLTLADIIGLITNPEAALESENTWAYFSHDVFVQLYIALGFSQEEAIAIASRWPEGAYVRYVNVGNNWNS